MNSPMVILVNSSLNSMEIAETEGKIEVLKKELEKSLFIVPEITDYPYFRETTQVSLNFKQRD